MNLVEKMVLEQGIALSNDVLKVDAFLNQQIQLSFMKEVGRLFADYFKDKVITKILTIESSGIAPAYATALQLDVPVVIAKKKTCLTSSSNTYQSKVYSFTKQYTYNMSVDQDFLSPTDRILIIDDFLANGQAALGAIDICDQAQVNVIGFGAVIEKSFQKGRQLLDEMDIDVYSLARVQSLENQQIQLL